MCGYKEPMEAWRRTTEQGHKPRGSGTLLSLSPYLVRKADQYSILGVTRSSIHTSAFPVPRGPRRSPLLHTGGLVALQVIQQSIDSLVSQTVAHRLIVVIGLEEGTPEARLRETGGTAAVWTDEAGKWERSRKRRKGKGKCLLSLGGVEPLGPESRVLPWPCHDAGTQICCAVFLFKEEPNRGIWDCHKADELVELELSPKGTCFWKLLSSFNFNWPFCSG